MQEGKNTQTKSLSFSQGFFVYQFQFDKRQDHNDKDQIIKVNANKKISV